MFNETKFAEQEFGLRKTQFIQAWVVVRPATPKLDGIRNRTGLLSDASGLESCGFSYAEIRIFGSIVAASESRRLVTISEHLVE